MNDYIGIPEHLIDGLERWFRKGITPGGFLSATLSNDLFSAALRADPVSRAALGTIAVWIATNAPEGSWGRPEVLNDWPAYIRALETQAEHSHGPYRS